LTIELSTGATLKHLKAKYAKWYNILEVKICKIQRLAKATPTIGRRSLKDW